MVAADKALVLPKLENAAPIWNPHHHNDISRTKMYRVLLYTGPLDADITRTTPAHK